MQTKNTVHHFAKWKRDKRKIAMITAYDYTFARLFDQTGIDAILVGDSLGQVVLGYDSTCQVTVDEMVNHTKAVTAGVQKAFVVADMPFLSCAQGVPHAVRSAGRLIVQGGCQAVKIEGASEAVRECIKAIIDAGIPVMGHLGLTPQSVHQFGGYRVQAKNEEQAKRLCDDAVALQQLGVFALVLECIPHALAKLVTKMLSIPTIGIGGGVHCDGQILVCYDMLGLIEDFAPKHNKVYINGCETVKNAVQSYVEEVQNEKFPTESHSFGMDEKTMQKLGQGGSDDAVD